MPIFTLSITVMELEQADILEGAGDTHLITTWSVDSCPGVALPSTRMEPRVGLIDVGEQC